MKNSVRDNRLRNVDGNLTSLRSGVLSSIGYCSRSRKDLVDDEILNIVIHANVRNQQLGIQGILFIVEGRFLQVMEGRRGALVWLYERIESDPRHGSVTKLFDMPIRRLAFSGWPMRLISESDMTASGRRAIIAAFAFADARPLLDDAGRAGKSVPVDLVTAIVAGVIASRGDDRFCSASGSARCPDCAVLGNRCRRKLGGSTGLRPPAHIEIAASSEVAETNTPPDPQVLIIDDEVLLRQDLADELEIRGAAPIFADTIEDAIAVVASAPISFAVLDTHAGGCAGRPVIEMLRRIRPEMRIVVVTRYGSVAAAVAAVLAGAADFLPKPAAVQEIADALMQTDRSAPTLVQLSPHVVRWRHIHTVFESTGQNISETARRLGMHRRTLQRTLQRGPPQ